MTSGVVERDQWREKGYTAYIFDRYRPIGDIINSKTAVCHKPKFWKNVNCRTVTLDAYTPSEN